MPTRGRNNLSEETIFFVTTTVVRFLKIFNNPAVCDILINNIKYYQNIYKYEVLAYSIMPSHFHWIVVTNPKYGTISDIMRDLKRNSSKEIMEFLKSYENLTKIFKEEAIPFPGQEKKLWMKRFDDEVIRNDKMFWQKVGYIHNNPIEDGMVYKAEDYKYSSARNYVNNDHSTLEVNVHFGGVRLL